MANFMRKKYFHGTIAVHDSDNKLVLQEEKKEREGEREIETDKQRG